MSTTDGPGRVDLHAHVIAPVYRQALEDAGRGMIGGIPVPEWTPELALGFMDEYGIALQMLSVSDPGVAFLSGAAAAELAQATNEYIADVIAAHPGRFGGLAVLPLDDIDAAITQATYALDTLGLHGVGLLSSAGGRYLGDPYFAPLHEFLNDRGTWVFVHPTAVPADARPTLPVPEFIAEYPFDSTRAVISLIANAIHIRFPQIRWHVAHGGGTVPMLRLRLDTLSRLAAVAGPLLGLPDEASLLTADSARDALAGTFYDTALVHDEPALLAVRSMAGPERLVFGSDWPFAGGLYQGGGDPQPDLDLVFDANERQAIDHGNATGAFPSLEVVGRDRA